LLIFTILITMIIIIKRIKVIHVALYKCFD